MAELLVKFIKHNQNYYGKLDVLTSVLEAFVRRSWYSVLPILNMNRKNQVPASSDEGLWQKSKREVLGNNIGCFDECN